MRTVPSRGISPKGHHRAKGNWFLEEGERAVHPSSRIYQQPTRLLCVVLQMYTKKWECRLLVNFHPCCEYPKSSIKGRWGSELHQSPPHPHPHPRIQPEQLCFHPFYILEAVFVNARYSRLIWTDILFIIQDYCSKVQVFWHAKYGVKNT